MNNDALQDAYVRAVCQTHLGRLKQENPEIDGALIATADGFELADCVPTGVTANRLAAMTSSFLALAEAISQESVAGQCRDVLIEASLGFVLLMDIPSVKQRAVLCVLCSEAATLGRVRWSARQAREQVAKALDVQLSVTAAQAAALARLQA